MREISFRAYNPQTNVLEDDIQVNFLEDGDYWVQSWYDFEDEHVADNGWEMFGTKKDGVILNQYTGLKDKNGKKVYEGDVCEYTTGTPGGHLVFYVGWDTKNARFCEINETEIFDGSFLKQVDKVEIIGNVFHDPIYVKKHI